MKKRPIVTIAIGFIIGILGGIYVKVIPLFLIIIIMILVCLPKKYFRYIKLYISFSSCIILILSIICTYTYLKFCDKKYALIREEKVFETIGIIQSNPKENEYNIEYTIKVDEIKNLKNLAFKIYINKEADNSLYKYGDKIVFKGEIEKPTKNRNTNGFNQKLYYQTKGIYGKIYATYTMKIGEEHNFWSFGNSIRLSIEKKLKTFLSPENANLLSAILTGSKDELSKENIENFQNSSLIHILCVSGSHISFLMLGVQKLLNNIGRKKKYIISFVILILFNAITGFSGSVARASIMSGFMIIGKLLFKQNDVINSISLSAILLLIYNPFLLFDTGLLLSYGGTIGILLFAKPIEAVNLKNCGKLYTYFTKNVIVSFSAQIILAPIIAYLFQKIYPCFFISNLLATPIFQIILYLGTIFIILSFLFPPICIILSKILEIFLTTFQMVAEISAMFPFSNFYITRPCLYFLVLYYITLFIIYFICITQKNYLRKLKEKFIINKILKKWFIFIIIIFTATHTIMKLFSNFEICFIDVGQGDATFIKTKTGKTIMIDSGGSKNNTDYDIGEKVLIPYLLSKGISKLDYILVSHFHADHSNGFLAILENINVKNILISKQGLDTKEGNDFLKTAIKENINIYYVETGQIIKIDKNTKLEILFVGEDDENLNNSSIISRITYNNFSMLFTGDAEESQEKRLLKLYKNKSIISDILKVGHHGSNTSTCEELLEKVKPKIALIGVGEKNTFEHPSPSIINRLKKFNCKIYRTDLMGEIIISVEKNSAFTVKTVM